MIAREELKGSIVLRPLGKGETPREQRGVSVRGRQPRTLRLSAGEREGQSFPEESRAAWRGGGIFPLDSVTKAGSSDPLPSVQLVLFHQE